MTEVIMPKMGDGMEEGTLLEWLKKEGESVKSGEVIGTIQTDKATLELEAPGSGTLAGVLVPEGSTVPVGKPMAAIVKQGEALPPGWGGGAASQAGNGQSQAQSAAPSAEGQTKAPANPPIELQQAAESNPVTPGGASAEFSVTPQQPAESITTDRGRIKASPLARKIAAAKGIDLSSVKGTGPGGRIVEKDVEAATAQPAAPAPIAATASDTTVQLNRLRQITAKRTAESKQQVPHFYVTVEVDVERILGLREMFEAEESGKVSINDFVVKASAFALRDMPEVNAVFQGASILQQGAINVGIAIAIPDGLTVAVIKNADRLPLRQIATASKDLAGRAKENKLSLDELSGSTFSISNMGMLDVDNFIAIINQPNSAILAISSARKKVVVGEDDEVEIRSRMNITCSFDHRVIDGAVGARFINVVKGYLENPSRLLA
jgi:pyruvate dehydrogenase E2 component (dihydrolipoamide acetyltransferase)